MINQDTRYLMLVNEGYGILVAAMALSVEFGFQPYASILPDGQYRVYYDFKRGKGKHKNFPIEKLLEAGEWIKNCISEEIRHNPQLVKKMYITPEEKITF